jgi:hypothetical protein
MTKPPVETTPGVQHPPEWVHEYWLHRAPTTYDTRMRAFDPNRLVLTLQWKSTDGWDLARVIVHGRTVGEEYATEMSYPSVGSRPDWVNTLIHELLPDAKADSPVVTNTPVRG